MNGMALKCMYKTPQSEMIHMYTQVNISGFQRKLTYITYNKIKAMSLFHI